MARKKAKQIGALWRHEAESVGQFLTGVLDLGGLGEVPIAVFKNDRKQDSRHPDFRIVLSHRLNLAKDKGSGGNGANGAPMMESDMPF